MPGALARHVKAAIVHLRQAERIAGLAGVGLDASEHEVREAGLFRAAGDATEDLDLRACGNARAQAASPAGTCQHTQRWWHAPGGALPAGSWPGESGASPDAGAARAALRSGLERLCQAREGWDETVRACTSSPGLCSRRDPATVTERKHSSGVTARRPRRSPNPAWATGGPDDWRPRRSALRDPAAKTGVWSISGRVPVARHHGVARPSRRPGSGMTVRSHFQRTPARVPRFWVAVAHRVSVDRLPSRERRGAACREEQTRSLFMARVDRGEWMASRPGQRRTR
jgi:hypothetical protein